MIFPTKVGEKNLGGGGGGGHGVPRPLPLLQPLSYKRLGTWPRIVLDLSSHDHFPIVYAKPLLHQSHQGIHC